MGFSLYISVMFYQWPSHTVSLCNRKFDLIILTFLSGPLTSFVLQLSPICLGLSPQCHFCLSFGLNPRHRPCHSSSGATACRQCNRIHNAILQHHPKNKNKSSCEIVFLAMKGYLDFDVFIRQFLLLLRLFSLASLLLSPLSLLLLPLPLLFKLSSSPLLSLLLSYSL